MTGLGTPVANLLVSDLVAYQSGTFVASGPTVGALQNTTLTDTGVSGSGTTNVFSVFDSVIDTSNGLGDAHGQIFSTGLGSPISPALAPAGAGRTAASLLVATGFTFGPATRLSPAGLMPLVPADVTIAPVSTGLASRQPAWSTAQAAVKVPTSSELSAVLQRADLDIASVPSATKPPTGLVPDSVLDELTSDVVLVPGEGRGDWSCAGSWLGRRGGRADAV